MGTPARRVRAEVLLERIGGEAIPDPILWPTAGGPRAEYAADVARAIAHTTGVRLRRPLFNAGQRLSERM